MTGIYCIKVNNTIVYIGQSIDIKDRLKDHLIGIQYHFYKENKYQLLHSCYWRNEYKITFHIIERCRKTQLDEKEQFWIKLIHPCLNSTFNHNQGSTITAQEFYNIIYNEEHYINNLREVIL